MIETICGIMILYFIFEILAKCLRQKEKGNKKKRKEKTDKTNEMTNKEEFRRMLILYYKTNTDRETNIL